MSAESDSGAVQRPADGLLFDAVEVIALQLRTDRFERGSPLHDAWVRVRNAALAETQRSSHVSETNEKEQQ